MCSRRMWSRKWQPTSFWLVAPADDAAIKKIVPHSSADYTNEFLNRAQEFMTDLARDGLGLVYTIR